MVTRNPVALLRCAGILAGHPDRAARLLLLLATAWLAHGSLLARPVSYGDAGEYQLMGESWLRHLSPDVRPGDVVSLADRSRRQQAEVAVPTALGGYYEARDGRWYCYHFWLYSLTTLPARAVLRPLGADLRAPAVTNAVLFLVALWQALSSTQLGRAAGRSLFGLALFSPAVWFVPWPHPEAYCFALVLLALVWVHARHWTRALLAASLATAQCPALVWLVAPLGAAALGAAWRGGQARPTRLARVALASLPAALSPLFYLWKFGTPNLIARHAASLESVSLSRAWELLLDLNLGLWPYMPLAVPLFLLALWTRGAWPSRWAGAAVLALAALSCTATANWNHGTAGPSRYAVWLAPFVVFAVAQAQAAAGPLTRQGRLWSWLVGGAILAQALVVLARGGMQQAPDFLSHSWAARLVLRHAPAWYSPAPEVFITRSLGAPALRIHQRAAFADAHGCHKAWVRPKDVPWLERSCGNLPAGARARGLAGNPREWRYVDW